MAEEILRGSAAGANVTLHGVDICLYPFPYAGFLCDRPA